KWYRKSAEQGDKDAIERIEEIEFKNKNENKNKPINQEQVSKESIQYFWVIIVIVFVIVKLIKNC
ncbi:MAG: hypothetical protein N2450_09675, partial [bacterium]|nr:hypothetical protein [bacterium]